MKGEGCLLIIDGPSAVGKSTIFRALLAQSGMQFTLARRYTTRMKRGAEDDEDIYDFITHEEFNRLVAENAFIEHKCYKFGMCYGLPKSEVMEKLRNGKNVIAMINLGNIGKVKETVPDAFGVFIDASLDTIRTRLVGRGTHPPEQIEERLGNARDSRKYMPLYDFVVTNENRKIEDVAGDIIGKFRSHIGRANLSGTEQPSKRNE
jgi:guanylate kinase